MIILTVERVWLDKLYKSSKIKYVLNSSILAQINIKSITKLELLELFAYLVGTSVIDIDSSRLNKLATSLRVLTCMEW